MLDQPIQEAGGMMTLTDAYVRVNRYVLSLWLVVKVSVLEPEPWNRHIFNYLTAQLVNFFCQFKYLLVATPLEASWGTGVKGKGVIIVL